MLISVNYIKKKVKGLVNLDMVSGSQLFTGVIRGRTGPRMQSRSSSVSSVCLVAIKSD